MSFRLLPLFLALLMPDAASAVDFPRPLPPGRTQITVSVTEINPDQSVGGAGRNGGSGGRINSLSVASDGTTLYAASEWGGLFKSTNTGRTWTRLDNHLPTYTWDVAVSPADPNRVYAASWYDGRVASLAGINVSADGGATWMHPASAVPPPGFCANAADQDETSAFGISIDTSNPSNVYVGTSCGLVISTNSGTTWRWVDPTPADGADDVWDVEVHHNGIIDIVGDDNHMRSTDSANSWTTAAPANALPPGLSYLAISPHESYVLFATNGNSVFQTTNGGQTWPAGAARPNGSGRQAWVATVARSSTTYDLWSGGVSTVRAACTTPSPPVFGGAARCPNGPWTNVAAGAHDDSGDVAFSPLAGRCPIAYSNDGGVYRNTVTASPACHTPAWTQPDVTPHALWVFTLSGASTTVRGRPDLYFGCQDTGTFSSTQTVSSKRVWNNRDCCDGFDSAADGPTVLNTVCCGTSVNLRNRGGVGGIGVNTGVIGGPTTWLYTKNFFRLSPQSYAVSMANGVFLSTGVLPNVQPVWRRIGTQASTPAPPSGIKGGLLAGTTILYVARGGGWSPTLLSNPVTLFRHVGTANNTAWTQVLPPGNTGGFGIYDAGHSAPNVIFASHLTTAAPRMIISTDGGATWRGLPALDALLTRNGLYKATNAVGPTDFTGRWGYPQPTLAAVDPFNANVLVAGGADTGIFFSLNQGATWREAAASNTPPYVKAKPHIPRPHFAWFEHRPKRGFPDSIDVYVGTVGRGVWKFAIERKRVPPLIDCLKWKLCIDDVFDLGIEPFIDKDLIILQCPDPREPCVIRDPIPKNCLYKWDCPGCGRGGLCPPWYNIFLDNINPRQWDVALIAGDRLPVKHSVHARREGYVVTFRPDRERFNEKVIGDYSLVFTAKEPVKEAVKVRAVLKTGDRPWQP